MQLERSLHPLEVNFVVYELFALSKYVILHIRRLLHL